ncbi:hypothetical protein P3T37_003639 [Kitasatospora sp. MAA4]|uniref:hypothetical protein n=1 Tax=Kitasatospora sp. MAA4 TaxID=3035093 RepID=UPI002475DDBE|nr:hypothetical protein [Kitasatospora sp. MAA4]MDH6134237.1 hypothetical protein [Kitasatospora sp. MAA4]
MSAKPTVPAIGTYVVDLRSDRVAEVMDYRAGVLYLRRPAGGPEWTRALSQVRPTAALESLSARVARLNAMTKRHTG